MIVFPHWFFTTVKPVNPTLLDAFLIAVYVDAKAQL
jgi:hypothetical protein